jgi:hypothetical protein
MVFIESVTSGRTRVVATRRFWHLFGLARNSVPRIPELLSAFAASAKYR